MSPCPEVTGAAIKHLRSSDKVLRGAIDDVGAYTLKLERNRFRMLVRSILSQQISTATARAIRGRLEELTGGITAKSLVVLDIQQLRAIGVSNQKAAYLLDLAKKTTERRIRFRSFARMADEEIISELTTIKGIGRWTAQMCLIFSLGRPDVFPTDDLGVRSAIRNLYGLESLPDKNGCEAIAAPWRPFASFASWYLWRSLDLPKRERLSPKTASRGL